MEKGGQDDTFILDFMETFDTPLMSYLNLNYLPMELVGRL